jgi:hypothetical protein
MSEWLKWALGVLFLLVVGSYGYTTSVNSGVDTKLARSEDRVIQRIDRLEDRMFKGR